MKIIKALVLTLFLIVFLLTTIFLLLFILLDPALVQKHKNTVNISTCLIKTLINITTYVIINCI